MTQTQNQEPKSIYTYLDYRAFIKDFYDFKKEHEGLTLRQFAHKAGFSSHAYLIQLIQGIRDASAQSARKIAKGFELSESEAEYLEYMVRFAHAQDLDEKNEHYRKMIRFRYKGELASIADDHFFLLSNWYILAIRELVTLPDFQEDYGWIAHHLYPRITTSQAREGLEILLKLGYLGRDENGKLEQKDPDLSTGPEVRSLHVANYHNSMFLLANHAMKKTPAKSRDISALIIPIDREEFRYIKRRIQEFRKELIQYLRDRQDLRAAEDHHVSEGTLEDFAAGRHRDRVLYNLSMQFFNLSRMKWD